MLSLIFPRYCLVCCTSLVGDEKYLCKECLDSLPRTDFHLNTDNPAAQKFYGKCDIQRCLCFCKYHKESEFSSIIHELKYHDNRKLARNLGSIYANEIIRGARHPSPNSWPNSIDYLVPVPLHPIKQMLRGYNQSEWIARGISDIWGTPIRTDILKKSINNRSQTTKGILQRYDNTRNAYMARSLDGLENKHILLVDDVLTTGSTLEACAHILENISDIKISIFTLGFAE